MHTDHTDIIYRPSNIIHVVAIKSFTWGIICAQPNALRLYYCLGHASFHTTVVRVYSVLAAKPLIVTKIIN